ncbi:unnamed protein product [Amoebophrya sp. A120]|nr:unnamed protein product [Amoebophrya sp. A120]|eukprot:GSA120T00013033001.1
MASQLKLINIAGDDAAVVEIPGFVATVKDLEAFLQKPTRSGLLVDEPASYKFLFLVPCEGADFLSPASNWREEAQKGGEGQAEEENEHDSDGSVAAADSGGNTRRTKEDDSSEFALQYFARPKDLKDLLREMCRKEGSDHIVHSVKLRPNFISAYDDYESFDLPAYIYIARPLDGAEEAAACTCLEVLGLTIEGIGHLCDVSSQAVVRAAAQYCQSIKANTVESWDRFAVAYVRGVLRIRDVEGDQDAQVKLTEMLLELMNFAENYNAAELVSTLMRVRCTVEDAEDHCLYQGDVVPSPLPHLFLRRAWRKRTSLPRALLFLLQELDWPEELYDWRSGHGATMLSFCMLHSDLLDQTRSATSVLKWRSFAELGAFLAKQMSLNQFPAQDSAWGKGLVKAAVYATKSREFLPAVVAIKDRFLELLPDCDINLDYLIRTVQRGLESDVPTSEPNSDSIPEACRILQEILEKLTELQRRRERSAS